MTPTSAAAADPVDLWSRLEAGCAAVVDLSRQVEARLQAGAGGADLVPLLGRQRDAVDDLREQIGCLAAAPGLVDAERRDGIAARLHEVLVVDRRSRQLLQRRGVRLKPPRWRRGPTRKGS